MPDLAAAEAATKLKAAIRSMAEDGIATFAEIAEDDISSIDLMAAFALTMFHFGVCVGRDDIAQAVADALVELNPEDMSEGVEEIRALMADA